MGLSKHPILYLSCYYVLKHLKLSLLINSDVHNYCQNKNEMITLHNYIFSIKADDFTKRKQMEELVKTWD